MHACGHHDLGTPVAEGPPVTLEIDGVTVTVPAGTSVMSAAALSCRSPPSGLEHERQDSIIQLVSAGPRGRGVSGTLHDGGSCERSDLRRMDGSKSAGFAGAEFQFRDGLRQRPAAHRPVRRTPFLERHLGIRWNHVEKTAAEHGPSGAC